MPRRAGAEAAPGRLLAWRKQLAVTAVLLTLPLAALVGASPAAGYAGTTVSITFDDGLATQHMTGTALQARGMAATYYVSSGLIGTSGYYMP